MLQTVFQKMKDVLPPKASFRLRTLKSDFLDHELRQLRRFARLVGGPEVTALDIGANSGIYSAALSTYFKSVTAVEPNPDCVAYMRRVLPGNCTVVSAAVSDFEGRTTLRIPIVGTATETTRATISTENAFSGLAVSGTREIDVEVRSIDGLAKSRLVDVNRLGLLKIDVEGHESAVLEGAKDLLRSARPGLCIEMERRHGTQTDQALALLHEIGYRIVRFEGNRCVTDETALAGAQDAAHEDAVNLFFVTDDKLAALHRAA